MLQLLLQEAPLTQSSAVEGWPAGPAATSAGEAASPSPSPFTTALPDRSSFAGDLEGALLAAGPAPAVASALEGDAEVLTALAPQAATLASSAQAQLQPHAQRVRQQQQQREEGAGLEREAYGLQGPFAGTALHKFGAGEGAEAGRQQQAQVTEETPVSGKP